MDQKMQATPSLQESSWESHSCLGQPIQSSKTSYTFEEQKEACPPQYESEYKWKKAELKGEEKVWYRKMDGMANFVLHWQYRFHNHGDIYAHGNLQLVKPQNEEKIPQITALNLREALRRMRSVHPITAVAVRPRRELNAEPIVLPKKLQHLKLQVCLAYSVPRSEKDVQDWLNQIIVIHDSCEDRDFISFFRAISSVKRSSTDSLRVHLWEADAEHGHPARLLVEQSHVISDGVGLLTTFDELVRFLALTLADTSPSLIEWGPEVARLPPSLQDAIALPPTSWVVSKKELREIERDSRARMAGKTKPNLLDKGMDRVLELTLANNASRSKTRRTLNWPLARVIQSVAQSGQVFPLGLLPQAQKPYSGPWTCCDYIEDTFSKSQTVKLLAGLKRHQITLAPFLEAAMAFATTWVRRQRGLTAAKDWWDAPSKVLGSFSNAMSKRGELVPDHQRYLGLAMAGIVTKISASEARWSQESLDDAIPSPEDIETLVPRKVKERDMMSILSVAKELSKQYQAGRQDANWLKYDQATMFSSMQSEYLLLSNEAYYPSHPWLSSVGRLDSYVTRTRPLTAKQSSAYAQCDSTRQIPDNRCVLEVNNLRIIGRTNLAQAIFHAYSFDGEMTFTVSYPDWLYNTNENGRKTKRHGVDYSHRPNIIPVWYGIIKTILYSLMDATVV